MVDYFTLKAFFSAVPGQCCAVPGQRCAMHGQCCLLCAAPCKTSSICDDCNRQLPRVIQACPLCGVSQTHPHRCASCLQTPPEYSRCISAFEYRYPIIPLIHQAKYYASFSALTFLTGELVNTMCDAGPLPDYLLPVPLHAYRLIKRGYNQADFIASGLSRALNVARLSRHLLRVRATQEQTALAPIQRRRNVGGAFSLREIPACEHIAIVDDVVTTGSTCNEIARLLKQAGVKKVDVWALARASNH